MKARTYTRLAWTIGIGVPWLALVAVAILAYSTGSM